MPNTIALAERYAPILDEVYKRESLTSVLDTPSDLVMFEGANTAKIFKMEMDGLADYSRNTGYATGSVVGSWEPLQLAYDRGRLFLVDNMDNEETLDMAFGSLAGEFVRTQEIPEGDQYCFSKICAKSGIGAATPADIANVTDILAAVDQGQAALDDAEAPMEGRILFVSTKTYYAIKNKLTRFIMNDEENVQRNIEMLDSMRVIPVPNGRFATAVTLGTSGYTQSGYPINFLLVHPSAVVKVMKHRVPRIFSPDVVQDADAWKFSIRCYGDTFVKDNKVGGIYLHRGATAI